MNRCLVVVIGVLVGIGLAGCEPSAEVMASEESPAIQPKSSRTYDDIGDDTTFSWTLVTEGEGGFGYLSFVAFADGDASEPNPMTAIDLYSVLGPKLPTAIEVLATLPDNSEHRFRIPEARSIGARATCAQVRLMALAESVKIRMGGDVAVLTPKSLEQVRDVYSAMRCREETPGDPDVSYDEDLDRTTFRWILPTDRGRLAIEEERPGMHLAVERLYSADIRDLDDPGVEDFQIATRDEFGFDRRENLLTYGIGDDHRYATLHCDDMARASQAIAVQVVTNSGVMNLMPDAIDTLGEVYSLMQCD